MKLNNRGQALVLFIVLFPIIFFVIAFFLENMLITSEKNKVNNIGELAIKYAYQNKDDEEIDANFYKIVSENDKDIKIKKLYFTDDSIEIILYKKVDSIFGKIVGMKSYDVVSSYTANIVDDKVTYTRK